MLVQSNDRRIECVECGLISFGKVLVIDNDVVVCGECLAEADSLVGGDQRYSTVTAKISTDVLAWTALRLINRDEFNHRVWSIWHAEIFEKLAKLIRDGYELDSAGE